MSFIMNWKEKKIRDQVNQISFFFFVSPLFSNYQNLLVSFLILVEFWLQKMEDFVSAILANFLLNMSENMYCKMSIQGVIVVNVSSLSNVSISY